MSYPGDKKRKDWTTFIPHFLGCLGSWSVVDGLGEQVLHGHKLPVKINVVGVQPSQNARCRVFFLEMELFPF